MKSAARHAYANYTYLTDHWFHTDHMCVLYIQHISQTYTSERGGLSPYERGEGVPFLSLAYTHMKRISHMTHMALH